MEIYRFGKHKLKWLNKYVAFPNGIPSHDTLGRFFASLEPDKFEECFIRWTDYLSRKTNSEVVAIEGKTLRGYYDNKSSKSAIHWLMPGQASMVL